MSTRRSSPLGRSAARSSSHAAHLVVLAPALPYLPGDLAPALGPLHRLVLDLERLDRLGTVGRVAVDADRVADLERAIGQGDRRNADPGVVVRHDADLRFGGHGNLRDLF